VGGEPLRVRYAGSRCTSEESKSGRDGYDPGESRILLNIARALNFLPIKPPASPTPRFVLFLRSVQTPSSLLPLFPSPPQSLASLFLAAFALTTYIAASFSLSLSLLLSRSLNLIRSLPARLPKPSGVGYSVTVHERRLISIPATPPSPSLPSHTAHGRNFHRSATLSGYVRQILSRILECRPS